MVKLIFIGVVTASFMLINSKGTIRNNENLSASVSDCQVESFLLQKNQILVYCNCFVNDYFAGHLFSRNSIPGSGMICIPPKPGQTADNSYSSVSGSFYSTR